MQKQTFEINDNADNACVNGYHNNDINIMLPNGYVIFVKPE